MESWRVSRTVIANSHRFDAEHDPFPHESVGSGLPGVAITIALSAYIYSIVAAPLTLHPVVADIDSLLWQPQLHCPPTYIVAAPLTP
jgi:hypothetical protein